MAKASTSNHPTALKITRVLSFLTVSILLFYYGFYDSSLKFFVYLTHWGMMLTFTYFILSLVNYITDYTDSAVCTMFLVIWGFNWVITLSFWCYLVPVRGLTEVIRGTTTHSIPLILTLIDFSLNKIQFDRQKFIIVFSVLCLYFLSCLLPYTISVKPIYEGIDFENFTSYAMFFGNFLVIILVLELGRLLRIKIDQSDRKNSARLDENEDNENSQPLLVVVKD